MKFNQLIDFDLGTEFPPRHTRFCEEINAKKGLQLLHLTRDELKRVTKNNGCNEFQGRPQDVNKKVENFRWWLYHLIEANGQGVTNYGLGNNRTEGRLIVRDTYKAIGLQSIPKLLRGFLCEDIYRDFDMKCAHPSIFLYVCKRADQLGMKSNGQKIDYGLLDKYVNNREQCHKEWKLNKSIVNITLFDIRIHKSGTNNEGNRFLQQLHELRKIFYDDPDLNIFPTPQANGKDEVNLVGTFLSHFLQAIEACILNKVLDKIKLEAPNYYDHCIPFFDGIFIPKAYELKISDLDKITKQYGIKWSEKPIVNCLPPLAPSKYMVYADKKKEWESTYSIVRSPFYALAKSTQERGRTMIELEPIKSGKNFHINHNCYSINEGKTQVDDNKLSLSPFFQIWEIDPNRLEYDKAVFKPYPYNFPEKSTLKENEINLFNGYHSKRVDYTGNEDVIKLFRKHMIEVACNHRHDIAEELMNWVSHKFQFPNKNSPMIYIFNGLPGSGKTSVFNVFRYLMDGPVENINSLTYSSEKISKDCRFNLQLDNKLAINFDELSLKEHSAHIEMVKTLISENIINIEKKGIDKEMKEKYFNVMGTSDKLSACVDIDTGDRRFNIIDTNPVYSASHAKQQYGLDRHPYWNEYYGALGNQDNRNILLSYLLDRDVDDWEPKILDTKGRRQMIANSLVPIVEYVKQIYLRDKEKVKGDIYRIDTTTFRMGYEIFINETHQGQRCLHAKAITGALQSSFPNSIITTNKGGLTHSTSYKGESKRVYKFNLGLLGQELQKALPFEDDVVEEVGDGDIIDDEGECLIDE